MIEQNISKEIVNMSLPINYIENKVWISRDSVKENYIKKFKIRNVLIKLLVLSKKGNYIKVDDIINELKLKPSKGERK
jgi:hypothetical protein